LHQHAGGRHFSEQFAHGRRVCASGCVARAPAQDFLPGFGQAHDHAAHRQAVKNEFVEFGHDQTRVVRHPGAVAEAGLVLAE
jgi:hypothetical protein